MPSNLPNSFKMVAFDIWSDYGHFRRGYTTTSPLTYPFPSRTAIAGLLAAIMGMERDSYYDLFDEENSAIAIRILNPIKKVTMNQNLIDTKTGYYLWDNNGQRTQITYEYLKNPKYRIFVWLKDEEKFRYLCDMVKNRKTVFSLYMGLSEHIAQFSPYSGGCLRVKRKVVNGEKTKIHSVIPVGDAKIVIDPEDRESVYGYVKVPGFMNRDRTVKKYIEFYYEENGRPLWISEGVYYSVNEDENIIPF